MNDLKNGMSDQCDDVTIESRMTHSRGEEAHPRLTQKHTIKQCPMCQAYCFIDMDVCYGCLYSFERGTESPISLEVPYDCSYSPEQPHDLKQYADLEQQRSANQSHDSLPQESTPNASRTIDFKQSQGFPQNEDLTAQGSSQKQGSDQCVSDASNQDRKQTACPNITDTEQHYEQQAIPTNAFDNERLLEQHQDDGLNYQLGDLISVNMEEDSANPRVHIKSNTGAEQSNDTYEILISIRIPKEIARPKLV